MGDAGQRPEGSAEGVRASQAEDVRALTPGWAVKTAALALGGGAWLVFAVSGGIVSLIGTMVPFAAAGGAVFSGLAIGPCRRAGAARARMFDGMPELY